MNLAKVTSTLQQKQKNLITTRKNSMVNEWAMSGVPVYMRDPRHQSKMLVFYKGVSQRQILMDDFAMARLKICCYLSMKHCAS